MRKKVLVFNGYYIPAKNYGGPTTSLANVVEKCSDDFEFFIIAANHDLNDNTVFDNIHAGWNSVGKAKVLYVDLNEIYYKPRRIRKILTQLNPDLVWLIGILVIADKWCIAPICRKLNIPFIISPRGEVCENTFHMKYLKKKIVAELSKIIGVYKGAWYHATSIEEKEGLIRYYGVDSKRIFLVSNIASNLSAKNRIINKQSGSIQIVFISRIQEKKNLLTAIKAVNKLKGEVSFDIYGPMEDQEYWGICQKEINNSPPGVTIKYRGSLLPEQVGDTFSKYHCFLFPTMSENYGHVIVEALSVCCPIVLSKGTTPWDGIDNKAGFLCALNDIEMFTEKITKILLMDNDEYNCLLLDTKEFFDKKIAADDAVNLHKKMLQCVIDGKSS